MPEKTTVDRARKALREGKSPTTAAGEFVRQEVEHVRRGKHGARSPKQAIAIGLSKARRAGVPLPPPAKGQAKERTRKSAARAYEAGQGKRKPRRSPRRSAATERALRRERRTSVSARELSRQAKSAAKRRRRGGRSGSRRGTRRSSR